MRTPAAVYEQIRAELVRNEEAARDAFVKAPLGSASVAIDAYYRALAARTSWDAWIEIRPRVVADSLTPLLTTET